MADGFLGRWSQRKQAVRQGLPIADPVIQSNSPVVPVKSAQAATVLRSEEPPSTPGVGAPTAAADTTQPLTVAAPAPAPALTLADVQALQPDDSFARFVAPDVSPQVRNAAMKKLFADPHYNLMDGLDIYIDDYSIASPLPAATLRQMASAKFLNLFDEDPTEAKAAAPTAIGEDAHTAPAPSVAQSEPAADSADSQAPLPAQTPAPTAADDLIKDTPHDHLDLRLQPDPAAGPTGFERQPERAADPTQQPVPPRSG